VKLDAQGDLWGDWDPDRMAQVISNLVETRCSTAMATSRDAPRQTDFVVLETNNGGPSIPRDVLAHISNPPPRRRARGASGRALHRPTDRPGARGSIEVRSNGHGTTFTAALPRKGRQKA